ncbi:hypothetical protein FHS43_003073 [Streptosporangium becharense]|uniref:Putative metalloprotease n=1 Tax=Streptosporangium becharense TaxID=1816182 RepID=A0A7W9IKJ0_9ACTN|nr:neutral zinc metallopeptidase [Streptosporangium becharense]MBB2911800.1 hypothetical protein [Streptosporangium becharense]MBB5822382.1 putative metalloprotease [Streptosporangium becharense]
MRKSLIVLLSGMLAGVVFAGTTGTATAEHLRPAPKGKAALTANPIYKTGKLEPDACQEQPVYNDDPETAEIYLDFVLDCLNEAWGYQFGKAKMTFSKPKFLASTRPGARTGCGTFPKNAQAIYCSRNNQITFHLSEGILAQATELFLLQTMAHEYGHHVQELSGILPAYRSQKYRSNKEILAATRKIELQAECLSGVFLGSTWRSLNRRESDLAYVVRAAQSTSTHGKAENVAYWVTRGFHQEDPGACNTFTAPKSKVS